MCLGRVSEVYLVFKLMARMMVRMPLATAETVGISQTPFRPKRGVRMNRQEIGKNKVPSLVFRSKRLAAMRGVFCLWTGQEGG